MAFESLTAPESRMRPSLRLSHYLHSAGNGKTCRAYPGAFSTAAIRQFKVLEWRRIEVLYDSDRRLVGFRPTEDPSGLAIWSKGPSHAAVSLGVLAAAIGLPVNRSIRIDLSHDPKSGLVIGKIPKIPSLTGQPKE